MAESSTQRRIWMALSRIGLRLFRNQVGLAYQGRTERFASGGTLQVGSGDVIIRNARTMRCGLCTGSSDLIGWRTVEIGPGDVGRRIAQFVAVEVKVTTGESPDQVMFRQTVLKAGGVAIVARSEEQALGEFRDR